MERENRRMNIEQTTHDGRVAWEMDSVMGSATKRADQQRRHILSPVRKRARVL
jgi:hypothetical protein